jgi:hypothetical protein
MQWPDPAASFSTYAICALRRRTFCSVKYLYYYHLLASSSYAFPHQPALPPPSKQSTPLPIPVTMFIHSRSASFCGLQA